MPSVRDSPKQDDSEPAEQARRREERQREPQVAAPAPRAVTGPGAPLARTAVEPAAQHQPVEKQPEPASWPAVPMAHPAPQALPVQAPKPVLRPERSGS